MLYCKQSLDGFKRLVLFWDFKDIFIKQVKFIFLFDGYNHAEIRKYEFNKERILFKEKVDFIAAEKKSAVIQYFGGYQPHNYSYYRYYESVKRSFLKGELNNDDNGWNA